MSNDSIKSISEAYKGMHEENVNEIFGKKSKRDPEPTKDNIIQGINDTLNSMEQLLGFIDKGNDMQDEVATLDENEMRDLEKGLEAASSALITIQKRVKADFN